MRSGFFYFSVKVLLSVKLIQSEPMQIFKNLEEHIEHIALVLLVTALSMIAQLSILNKTHSTLIFNQIGEIYYQNIETKKNDLLPRGLFYIQDTNTEKFLTLYLFFILKFEIRITGMNTKEQITFSNFLILSIAVEVANFFNFLISQYNSRGYYHCLPTYQYYPPYSNLKKDSYPNLHYSNKYYFLVCG